MLIDTVRHILGIVLVVSTPPAIAYWLVIHPFARRWRQLEIRVTYAILAVFMVGMGALLFAARAVLMGRDLGTSWPLIGVGGVLYLMAVAVSLEARKQLSARTFAGVPELSQAAFPGQMLHEGVYAVIRHPRYLSVILGTVGMGLAVNFAGAYLLLVVSLLGLWPLIRMEERELVSRFGSAYVAYRSRVPALIPRFRRP